MTRPIVVERETLLLLEEALVCMEKLIEHAALSLTSVFVTNETVAKSELTIVREERSVCALEVVGRAIDSLREGKNRIEHEIGRSIQEAAE